VNKQRIVVVCPGRGSYSRDTNGYFNNHDNKASSHLSVINNKRIKDGQLGIIELDSMSFKSKIHMTGENASSLIYACSLNDFLSLDLNKYEIVAVTGNSMGWYSALAFAGALSYENGYDLVNTMGSMMKNKIIGGQIIYPITNKNWVIDKRIQQKVLNEIYEARAHISIILGGYIVIGGSNESLRKLLKKLPSIENYPFQIPFHGAFHTPLMEKISKFGFDKIPKSFFSKPAIPLIDGRGFIWSPYSTNLHELYKYTLKTQVTETFNFTKSISTALKEFSPDKLILLGPGNSLGGATGQIIIKNNWNSIKTKKSFLHEQEKDPFLISMGISEQRDIVSL
tara:strand:+ start:1101 stop:2117 length:1017 start_codon:yes stop_codon:yes gene_type:complete